MPLPIFPGPDLVKGLSYTSQWSPAFFNHSVTTATGAEIDVAIARYPLHDFQLTYRFLRDGAAWEDALSALELRTMMGFFLQMAGSLGRCLYRNPDDHQVFRQPVGIGDGSTTSFVLSRSFGANGFVAAEPVGQVDVAAGVNVYLGGSPSPVVPSSYAIGTSVPGQNTILFTTAPAAGQAIAIDMAYFYFCKLDARAIAFEKFMDRIWRLGKIVLHGCRPGTLSAPLVVSAPIFTLPVAIRDQGMGATDTAGFVAAFPFIPAATVARMTWVDGHAGSASYNGLSPYPGYRMDGSGKNFQLGAAGPGLADTAYGPMIDTVKALNSAANSYPMPYGTGAGVPNQFFFAEGQSFSIDGGVSSNWQYMGGSANGIACFQSYDPADPLNLAKHGRAGTAGRGARPIFTLGATIAAGSPNAGTPSWPSFTVGNATDFGGVAFRGLEFYNPTDYIQTIYLASYLNNVLFENMALDNIQLTIQNADSVASANYNRNNIVRLCAIYGQYDFGANRPQGIYAQNCDITIEDCVFWHNGWKIGLDRIKGAPGAPTTYSHCCYLHSTALVRRNLFIDPAYAGVSNRGHHTMAHNVMIDCPHPSPKNGGAQASNPDDPAGVDQLELCSLVLGGANITSDPADAAGFGFSSQDGTVASYLKFSLFVNNPIIGGDNNRWLAIANGLSHTPSYMDFVGNQAYSFANPPERLVALVYTEQGGNMGSLAGNLYTDIDNILSVTSPMTNAQIYAQIGFTNPDPVGQKQDMIAAMIADPTQQWAYQLMAAAATGFNFSFNHTLT